MASSNPPPPQSILKKKELSSSSSFTPLPQAALFINQHNKQPSNHQSSSHHLPGTSLFQSTSSTPAPILKPPSNNNNINSMKSSNSSTRKRSHAPSFSVEFSRDTLTTTAASAAAHKEESDTDVGSTNTDTSYNFDYDDDIDDNVNAYDKTPETTNSKYSISRVGAKVRRLDLNGSKQRRVAVVKGKNDDDYYVSSASSKSAVLDTIGSSSGNYTINSPKRDGDAAATRMNTYHPASTTRKKGAISRVMLSKGLVSMNNDDDDENIMENEDISPRDAADFPFFDSPDRQCEGVKVMNNADNELMFGQCSNHIAAAADGGFDDVPSCPPPTATKFNHQTEASSSSPRRTLKSYGRADSFLQMFSQEEHNKNLIPTTQMNDTMSCSPPSKCPPTTMKKSHSRRRDLSPPKSLRAHGRANSFLQMFSQDSLLPDEEDANMTDNDNDLVYSLKSPNELQMTQSSPITKHHPSPPQRSSSFSRFVADFEVVGTLGNGSFGSVYKVRNRMDKRMYAIKAAKREARGPADREHMLQEVYALAALSDDTTAAAMHIVGYHQAWMEGNRLYIQTELCDGSLEKEIGEGLMDEKRRYKVLREMSLALDLVHKSGMIHLDIKPENIFIKNNKYKLGDFGLVSKIENHDDVEEGDSRYMSMELLSGDLDDLTKSDIFSLGATMYEICLGRPLPENGQEWQDIRQGILQPMTNTPFELQMIVRAMLAPEKESRPSASDLLKKRQLMSDEQRQLIVERNKANAANMALNQMQRIQNRTLSPRKKLLRSNTVS